MVHHFATCPAIPALFSDEVRCDFCGEIVYNLHQHYRTCATVPELMTITDFQLIRQAFNGQSMLYRIAVSGDPAVVLEANVSGITDLLQSHNVEQNLALKVQVRLGVHMQRMVGGNVAAESTAWFASRTTTVHVGEGRQLCDEAAPFLLERIERYLRNGSGWLINTAQCLDIALTRFQLPHGAAAGTDRAHFQLPAKLKNKHAVINTFSTGSDCFKYAVMAALHSEDPLVRKHPLRASTFHQWEDEINFDHINFPASVRDLERVEKNNIGLAITAFRWANDRAECLRTASPQLIEGWRPHRLILLLLVSNHWVAIRNLNRLMNTKQAHQYQWCDRCLAKFRSLNELQSHKERCIKKKNSAQELMPKEKILQFSDWYKTISPAYVVYADFEALTPALGDENVARDVDVASVKIAQHTPAAAGFLTVQRKDVKGPALTQKPLQLFVRTDDNAAKCMAEFLHALEQTAIATYHWNKQYSHYPALRTAEDEQLFSSAVVCWLCQKPLNENRHFHHDHLNGKFIGAVCPSCNESAILKRAFLPVFFHNFRGYDAHLLCSTVIGKMQHWDLSVIAQTKEKYMTLEACIPTEQVWDVSKQKMVQKFTRLRFLDSYQFMASSLAKLVKNLELQDCEHILAMQQKYTRVSFSILQQKGIFPYSYITSVEKLEEPQLPAQHAFANDLTDQLCNDEDYSLAQQAWQEFECKTLRDYMLAYLEMDIRQLADVFEAFRRMSLTSDGLDPVHFITTPGMSFQAALKFCNLQLEMLQDPELYALFEEGIRCGMTFVNSHVATANHQSLPESYDCSKPQSHLIPVDANNLYGNALSTKLPWCDFRIEVEMNDVKQIERWIINEFDADGDRGYLFKVDLLYPFGLHDTTADLPLAPEKLIPHWDWMPSYQKHLWYKVMHQRNSLKPQKEYVGTEKLLLTCQNKTEYVVHGRILQFYLRQGLRLDRIHQVVSFKQAAILEPYIQRNSKRRSTAANEFEKDYNKLLNNSLFGKTMEDVRKREDYRLVNSAEKLNKLAAKPNFDDHFIFNDSLVLVHMRKTKVVLNKPIYIGQCVLDNSKLIMYELWYCKLLPMIKQRNAELHLLGGDTDSFFLQLTNADAETWFLPQLCAMELLDTSNYPKDHALFTNSRKAKLGCIKDESDGVAQFKEWILLRPKLYSFAAANTDKNKRRAKGIQRAVVEHGMQHSDFKEAFEHLKEKSWLTRRITSDRHELFTIATLKRALSFWEDKRAWTGANESLPYGHYRLSGQLKRTADLAQL
jgi:hypothetical protein